MFCTIISSHAAEVPGKCPFHETCSVSSSLGFDVYAYIYTGCFESRFTTWTCSNSSSFHNLVKMTKRDECTSSKTAQPLITIQTSASASTPLSHVDELVERRRHHGHLVPPILLRWIFFFWGFCHRPSAPATPTCKCRRAPNSNYHRSCRSDVRDGTSRFGRK
jgi:hypothetical protein